MSGKMLVDQLNREFAIGEALQFKAHASGLVLGQVANDFCTAEFFLHGAHVTRFQPVNQDQPVLFMSGSSAFHDQQPIRGGIPICFPWFSSHPTDRDAPSHGLARIQSWNLARAFDEEDGAIVVDLSTRIGDFQLAYRMNFSRELDAQLKVENRGSNEVTFEIALHSYFAISDTEHVKITGLEQASFIDQLENRQYDPSPHPVVFDREIDRIYTNTDATISIHDAAYDRIMEIEKLNSRSTVIWNPWIEKSRRMPDFGDDEFHHMCCVETANIRGNEIKLRPGASHTTGAVHRIR